MAVERFGNTTPIILFTESKTAPHYGKCLFALPLLFPLLLPFPLPFPLLPVMPLSLVSHTKDVGDKDGVVGDSEDTASEVG